VTLVAGGLAALAIVRLPGAVLVWLALSGVVHLPLVSRRGAMVPLGSAALPGMLLAWIGRHRRTRPLAVADTGLNRPLVALAVTTIASGLRGIYAADPEVAGLRRHVAVQVHASALPLLSVGAAFLVGNQMATLSQLRWLRRILLGVGGVQVVKELQLLPRPWRFPPWNDLIQGHAMSLAVASVLFGPGGLMPRTLLAGAAVGAWMRGVLLDVLRPNERQWISGWISLTVPPVVLLTARYPSSALLSLPAAGLMLGRRSGAFARILATARAKGDLDRFVIWRDAFRLARRRPILGVGPGNYPDYARRYFTAYGDAATPGRIWTAGIGSAHGNYPQLAAETGFAGLGAAAWVLAQSLATSYRLFRTADDPLLRSLAAGIGATLAGQIATGIIADTILPSYHNGGHSSISSTVYTWALIGALIAIDARHPGRAENGVPAASTDALDRVPVASLGRFTLATAGGAVLLGAVETAREVWASRRVTRPDRVRDLTDRLESRLVCFRGRIGVYAKDLASGVTYEHRGDERFPVSSVFKLFVLVHVFRRHEAGQLSLGERRSVPDAGVSRLGPGVLKYLRGRSSLSLLDHCRLMIVRSDNVATDVLMQTESPTAVNETLASLGLTASRVGGTCTEMVYRMAGWDPVVVSAESEREVARRLTRAELREAGFADGSPGGTVSTPRELGALCERLLRGELVNAADTTRILDMLESASLISRSMIPRFLPEGTTVAHRAGGSWRVQADAGIVDVRGRPIVMAVCAYHDPAETGAAELLADVSRMLFEWLRAPAHLAARS